MHFLQECPRLFWARRELFGDKIPCNDMQWSVRSILDFSYFPGINEAYEGTWAHGDPINAGDLDSMHLSLFSDAHQMSTEHRGR